MCPCGQGKQKGRVSVVVLVLVTAFTPLRNALASRHTSAALISDDLFAEERVIGALCGQDDALLSAPARPRPW